MSSIKIADVSFNIGNKPILENINLEIKPGEFFLLLGPSGCGKTTLLRTLAGFYQPQSGEIYFGDKQVTRLPPQSRNIGMVFQFYALFPHMAIGENIGYGLKIRRLSKKERNEKIQSALDSVRLPGYADRFPGSLSGGEQQRVALARALVISPDLLLLDEPLSNLDAKLRIQMRQELREIHRTTKVTMVYVTHDQDEALSMADRIAVMNQGKILQVGTPQEIYYRPANSFVAGFIGEANLFPGQVMEKTNGNQLLIQVDGAILTVSPRNLSFPSGTKVTCCLRPESIQVVETTTFTPGAALPAIITDYQFQGESIQLVLQVSPKLTLRALVPHPKDRQFERNQKVVFFIPPEEILLFQD